MAEIAEADDGECDNGCQDYGNVDAIRCLMDITFVRIHLDSVYMSEEDEFINEIIRRRSLFGFVLEYQFPSLDSVSSSLKTRVHINAKTFNGNTITFGHKRVIRVKMIPEVVALWKRSQVKFVLHAKLNTLGKFSIKRIGTCTVPLYELTIPPFIICRDFSFNAPGFSGSALIKIDLGSHIKTLMDRLEWMRSGKLPEGGEVTRARSRSSSRCKTVGGSSRNISPTGPQRATAFSSPTLSSRKRVKHFHAPLPFERRPEPYSPLNMDTSTSPSLPPLPDFHNSFLRICPPSPSYPVTLTVHSARRLPLSQSARGEAIAPSTYVSVIGEDGRILSSPVRASTFNPEWNWTESFRVSRSRQNLVVKLWKKVITGPDKVIGFVSLPLPPTRIEKCEYEMSDLSVSEQAPIITISLSYTTWCKNDFNFEPARKVLSPFAPQAAKPLTQWSPRLQMMTREEVFEKLRRNINELEQMMTKLKH